MEKDYYAESLLFSQATKKLSLDKIKELKSPFLTKIPKHLYKYRKSGAEGRIDFYVGQRKIYTASFNNLNDKFEGITPAVKNRILTNNARDVCLYYKDVIITSLNNKFKFDNLERANEVFDILLENFDDPDVIYENALKYVDKEQRKHLRTVLSALSYIFDRLENSLNTNSDFAKGMKMLMEINENMGAYCLCDSGTRDNLWADYADNFKGYCIEYDFSEPCRSKGSVRLVCCLFPVEYVDKKDDDWFKTVFSSMIDTINLNGRANQSDSGFEFNRWCLKALCQKKKKSWSNQAEWRVIGYANKSCLGPLISSIIVGHEICKDDFVKIKTICDKYYYPLKITDLDYANQEVIIRDINEKDIELIMKR